MKPIGLLIPAYKPPSQLLRLVEELLSHDFLEIIVVDDGSPKEFGEVFALLRNLKKVTVLSHAVNLGKGAALKTGFRYFSLHHPKAIGLVTADADGQHLVPDILKVANTFHENPDCLVLGCRQFDKKVPLRNRMGNRLTRLVFKVLLGIDVTDTQTGLRGIPTSLLHDLPQLRSGHYAFETDALITAHKKGYKKIETPISTVYFKNHASHFHPTKDSLEIYFVFFRFVWDVFRRLLWERITTSHNSTRERAGIHRGFW